MLSTMLETSLFVLYVGELNHSCKVPKEMRISQSSTVGNPKSLDPSWNRMKNRHQHRPQLPFLGANWACWWNAPLEPSLAGGFLSGKPQAQSMASPLASRASRSPQAVSLLLVALGTGRRHQIRAQLAFAGRPVLGDGKYCAQATETATGARPRRGGGRRVVAGGTV